MADFTAARFPQRRPLTSLRHNPSSATRHVDWALIGSLMVICGLGLVMIYSATRGAKPPYDLSYVKKQVMFMILGGMVAVAAAWIDYRRIRDFAVFIYGGMVGLLVLVLVPHIGSSIGGTQGWFVFGPFQLQPSEVAKLAVIIALAALASQFRGEVDGRRLGALLAVALIPIGVIMLEPDLGQSLVIGCVVLALMIVAGVKPRHLALLGLLAVLAVVVVLKSGTLDRYQQDRLTVFTQQESGDKATAAAKGTAYNLTQAKIAIGSGGLTGKGLFNGPQTKLGIVPEQRTDFIFTAVGEQFGFAGSSLLLALYCVIAWRIWRTAQLARDDFGTLLCVGILGMFLFQIFENAGMTMGIMPITGITLPFMSYGGSSLLVDFAALGLVLNVHMRRFT